MIKIPPFYPAAIICLHYVKCFFTKHMASFNSHGNSIGQRYLCSQNEEDWYFIVACLIFGPMFYRVSVPFALQFGSLVVVVCTFEFFYFYGINF